MIDLMIEQRRRSLGGGLEVGRVLPYTNHNGFIPLPEDPRPAPHPMS